MRAFAGLLVAAFLVSAVQSWSQQPVKFIPGQSYVYQYNGRLVSGITKLDQNAAALGIKSKIVLQPEQDGSRVLMKMIDIRVGKYNGEISEHLNGQIVMDYAENRDYEVELSKPIRVYIVDGQVKQFETEENELEWSINIKKSILSSISTILAPTKIISEYSTKNNMVHRPTNNKLVFYPVYEDGIGGICETVYQIYKAPNSWDEVEERDVLNVTKIRNYRNCLTEPTIENSNVDVRGAPVACRDGKSFPIVNGYYPLPEDETHLTGCPYGQHHEESPVERYHYVKYNLTSFKGWMQIDSINVEGRTVFNTEGNQIIVLVQQNITLKDVVATSQVGPITVSTQTKTHQELSFRLPKEQEVASLELPYYHLFGKVNQKELVELIPELLRSVSEDIVASDVDNNKMTTQKVIKLANAMAVLKKETLKQVFQQVAQPGRSTRATEHEKIVRKLFLDLLGSAGTTDSALLAKELYEQDKLTTMEAKEIFEAVPQNLFLIDVKVVEAYLNLFLSEKVQAQRHLASSLGITLGKLVHEATIKRQQTPGDINNQETVEKQRRAQYLVNNAQENAFVGQNYQQPQEMNRQYVPRIRRSAPWEKEFQQELLNKQQIQRIVGILSAALRESTTFHQKVTLIETLAHMGVPESLQILTPFVNNEAPLEQLPGYLIEDEDKIHEERNFLRQVTIYALSHVASGYPRQVVALLLPVFENVAEPYEIRIAAFTILLHSDPGRHILQRVAGELTHEKSRQVKSFVSSALNAAANFSDPSLKKLADDCRSAIELTPMNEDFGMEYSKMFSHNYYNTDKKHGFNLISEWVSNNVSRIPRSAYMSLLQTVGPFQTAMFEVGYNQKGLDQILERIMEPNGIFSDAIEAMTSRTKDRRVMKRAVDNAKQTLASLKEKLNLVLRNSEEPKATIFVKLFEKTSYFSLDRQYLQQVIDKSEDYITDLIASLVEGKSTHYVKLMMPTQMYKVVPSELGLPVVITDRLPTIVSVKISKAKLQIENSAKSHLPTGANMTIKIEPTIFHSKYQFVFALSPAEKQAIGTQICKNTRATFPVELTFGYQRANKQFVWSVVPKVPKELLHHSTDIKTFISKAAISGSPRQDWLEDSLVVRTQPETFKFEKEYLKKQFGLGFKVHVKTENPLDKRSFYNSETARKHGLVAALVEMYQCTDLTPRQVHIVLESEKENAVTGFDFSLRYKHVKQLNKEEDKIEESNLVDDEENEEWPEIKSNYKSGKLSRFTRNIQSELIPADKAWEQMYNNKFEKRSIKKLAIELIEKTNPIWQSTWDKEGKQWKKEETTQNVPTFVAHDIVLTAVARSSRPQLYVANVLMVRSLDERNYWTKVDAFTKKEDQEKNNEKQLCIEAIAAYPTIPNELNYEPTSTQDLRARLNAKIAYGMDCVNGAQIEINGFMDKTDDKVYKQEQFVERSDKTINNQPQDWFYQQCQVDRAQGQPLSYACEKAILEDSYFKQLVLDINYRNIDAHMINATRKLALFTKVALYNHLEVNDLDVNNKEDTVRVVAQYSNKISAIPMANLYIETPKENIKFDQIFVPYLRPVSALRPLRQVYRDLLTYSHGVDKCVLMENYVRTFDNVTIKMQSSPCQFLVAKDCSVQERFAIFARQIETESKTKEATILIDGTEIRLLPVVKSQVARIVVDGQTIELNAEKPVHLVKKTILIRLRETSTETPIVIVKSKQDDLKVLYDGINIDVRVGNKYRGSTCGLCGDNNKESKNEFSGPDNCIYKNAEDFVNSYALAGTHCEQTPIAKGPKRCAKKGEYTHVTRFLNELKNKVKEERIHTIQAQADVEDLRRNHQANIERQVARQDGQPMYYAQRAGMMGATPQQQQIIQRLRTFVLERAQEVCFSLQPVLTCVQNLSRPAQMQEQTLAFHCLPSTSISARRLAEQAQFTVLEIFSRKSADVTHRVNVPVGCIAIA